MSLLPPAHDAHGAVIPMDEDELYDYWAKIFLMDRAGGWSPESGPGRQAIVEFEAFIHETQARAVLAFATWQGDPEDAAALQYADDIRARRVNLSGNRLDVSRNG